MDFTYIEYKKLVNTLIEKGYETAKYHNFGAFQKAVILRHDVDMSLEKALIMAKLEQEEGVCSTYFVMVNTDFYNIHTLRATKILMEIQAMGHEIGLHYDEKATILEGVSWEEDMNKQCKVLSLAVGNQVRSMSMHRPNQEILNANINIPGLINAYSSVFFQEFKYVSDSFRRWREDPYTAINTGKHKYIQLLTHPFWYNDTNKSRRESFQQYMEEGFDHRYKLLEENTLPPNMTLEEALNLVEQE